MTESAQQEGAPAAQHALQREHDPAVVRERLRESPQHNYLGDFVYGAIDGTVTTFAVVSGAAGASLSSGVVIVLGIANLIGDGFSMAAANYLGVRSVRQLRERIRRTEEHHIHSYPDGEREEVRAIFREKGFDGDDLERAVEVITADRERWIDTMLTEEHGLPRAIPNPWRAASATFVAFIVAGSLPLAPFVSAHLGIPVVRTYLWSAVFAGVTFFLVGAWKARVVQQSWVRSGTETAVTGGLAACLAYLAGHVLAGLVQ